jgi:hypothetical protein
MEHTARAAVTSERVPAVCLLRVGALAAATDVGLLTRLGRREKGLLGRSGM